MKILQSILQKQHIDSNKTVSTEIEVDFSDDENDDCWTIEESKTVNDKLTFELENIPQLISHIGPLKQKIKLYTNELRNLIIL